MKNLKYLLILSLAITLFSCKKDDDNPTSANADLIGTWQLVEVVGIGSGTAVDSNNVPIPFTAIVNGRDLTSTITFTESPNNVVTSGTYSYDLVLTPTVGGNTVTFPYNDLSLLDNSGATWTRSGSDLTIVDGETTYAGTVTITNNTMRLDYTGDISEMNSQGTATGTLTTSQTYTKQ